MCVCVCVCVCVCLCVFAFGGHVFCPFATEIGTHTRHAQRKVCVIDCDIDTVPYVREQSCEEGLVALPHINLNQLINIVSSC